ncbi:hypothetical protein Tco_0405506 [Tanacetum coccineum]
MGDENPIRTLGDYSKPSHEGYRNTIEHPVGNNVVPLRSDTIRLVQNGCLFHGLRSEVPNQHLKDFLKLVDSLDLDTSGRLRKLRPDEAWAAIARLAQYEDEGWNDALILNEVSLNYEDLDIEQLLGIMERKVDTLMKDAISLMGKSEKERITQLKDYMQVIAEKFMKFSSEVTRRLKERIKENENKPRKIEKITKYPNTKVLENSAKHDFLENLEKKTFPTPANLLCVRYVRLIHSNPSQPRKNIFGFKPEERANLSCHNPSNSLTVQPPTQNDTTFMVNDPIKRDPSLHRSFTHVESNRVFDPGGKTHDLSFKGSHGLQFRNS